MIGYLKGEILFSDGSEVLLLTSQGIGYQMKHSSILAEGTQAEFFISHVFKETSQELYAFTKLQDKKIFELLLSVSGVGPKSAHSLVSTLGGKGVCDAILLENKKVLRAAPGIGAKTVEQIILDLSSKIQKMDLYSNLKAVKVSSDGPQTQVGGEHNLSIDIMSETLMACRELGFKDTQVLPLLQHILTEEKVEKAEDLMQKVLRRM
ncbi:MAG: hypothetical protein KBD63_02810 [Bacteriovoracaceae bacterium]|nr:hypothetical protein [Bacteriovoracaceae bacterium]